MKNDFTVADLTAIHTRLMLDAKNTADEAIEKFKSAKDRAKSEGVSYKDVKLALDYLNQDAKDLETRAQTIERVLGAFGHNVQLSFEFIRAADDWDRLRGQGRMAAIMRRPCEPPSDLKGHPREVWVEGWTDFMKVFDAYQDVLDEQADADRKEAGEALSAVFNQDTLDKIAADLTDDQTVVTITRAPARVA